MAQKTCSVIALVFETSVSYFLGRALTEMDIDARKSCNVCAFFGYFVDNFPAILLLFAWYLRYELFAVLVALKIF